MSFFFRIYIYYKEREILFLSDSVKVLSIYCGVPKGSISTFADGPFFTHRKIKILKHRVVIKGGGGKGEAALPLPPPPILRGSPHEDFQKGN